MPYIYYVGRNHAPKFDLATLPPLDLEQAKQIPAGRYVYSRFECMANGQPKRYLVSSVKTWKRDPYRIEVRAKFGLYDAVRIDARQLEDYSLSSTPS
jgi:hypothetical protein